MPTSEIVFYDLPCKPPQSTWSLNPWKTRFVLNYKGLDYRTQWTEYPDLKSTLEDKFPPDSGISRYTSPTVRLEDGTYVMDSRKIAAEIEKRHPEPPLHLDDAKLTKLEAILAELFPKLSAIYLPLVPVRLLNEPSAQYFRRTREERVGMPLEQFASEKGGDRAWHDAKSQLEQVTNLLNEDTNGPLFLGSSVSYADFVWAGMLVFFRRIGDDVFQRLLQETGGAAAHMKLLEAVKPWSERNDH